MSAVPSETTKSATSSITAGNISLSIIAFEVSSFGVLVGAFAPRINGIRLNYKQNSFERRVTNALHSLEKPFCTSDILKYL